MLRGRLPVVAGSGCPTIPLLRLLVVYVCVTARLHTPYVRSDSFPRLRRFPRVLFTLRVCAIPFGADPTPVACLPRSLRFPGLRYDAVTHVCCYTHTPLPVLCCPRHSSLLPLRITGWFGCCRFTFVRPGTFTTYVLRYGSTDVLTFVVAGRLRLRFGWFLPHGFYSFVTVCLLIGYVWITFVYLFVGCYV